MTKDFFSSISDPEKREREIVSALYDRLNALKSYIEKDQSNALTKNNTDVWATSVICANSEINFLNNLLDKIERS